MKTVVFSPQIFERDPRRCEFKFLCNCFIHSSLMPNNTFCLYFQVTLQTENKRIEQHGKHTNCLSNESIFPFIFESHTIPSKKPARTQIYQEENIASFGKRTLFVRMASKRFATKQLYKCSYLLGGIVYNLVFMSGL